MINISTSFNGNFVSVAISSNLIDRWSDGRLKVIWNVQMFNKNWCKNAERIDGVFYLLVLRSPPLNRATRFFVATWFLELPDQVCFPIEVSFSQICGKQKRKKFVVTILLKFLGWNCVCNRLLVDVTWIECFQKFDNPFVLSSIQWFQYRMRQL